VQLTSSASLTADKDERSTALSRGPTGFALEGELKVRMYRLHAFGDPLVPIHALQSEHTRHSWARRHPVYGELRGSWGTDLLDAIADGARRGGAGFMLLIRQLTVVELQEMLALWEQGTRAKALGLRGPYNLVFHPRLSDQRTSKHMVPAAIAAPTRPCDPVKSPVIG